MGTLCRRGNKGVWQWLAVMLLGTVLVLAAAAAAETGCRVIDGDTLRCGRERVRIQGVDTPEKGQPGYEAAKERLRELTKGKRLHIERVAKDKYGRTVAKVTVDGEDVGKRLKREGDVKPKKPRRRR